MDSSTTLQTALDAITDPFLKCTWGEARIIRKIAIEAGLCTIHLKFGYPIESQHIALIEKVKALCAPLVSLPLQVLVEGETQPHVVQNEIKRRPGIKNIIAIGSGKGGVGKSTVSANLALAMQAEGARVGLLDADIYGSSVPRILGIDRKAETKEKRFQPILAHGMPTMSIGYLVDPAEPMIWRGPMVSSALQQLLNDTDWPPLDYLIIDLPPGTGDIQLTLAQKVPVSAAIIVTTPQQVALSEAEKGLRMFQKVGVHVLGMIENMSVHSCPSCGHLSTIFGTGGGQRLAQYYEVPLLGKVPLDPEICAQADKGMPTVVANPTGSVAQLYQEMARRTMAALSLQAKDATLVFNKVKISTEALQ